MKNTVVFRKKHRCFLVFLLFLAACASKPAVKNEPPLWVTDQEKVYPDKDWLCVVEAEQDAKLAERAAITRLAQVFRVDLNSVTNANRQLAESINNVRGKTNLITSQSSDIAQELVSTSTVSGLIGLQVESWENNSGRSYANARMNRKECSARYSAMIKENENVIDHLKEEAEKNPGTFEALMYLKVAYSIALATDNFHSLLTVLDPSKIATRPSYGNAEAVNTLAQNASRAIIITVKVSGDVDNRIATAFTQSINARGFRTDASGNNIYTLDASFKLEDLNQEHPQYKFTRYILNYSLKNNANVEIFSHSVNDREAHLSHSEARQVAIRRAEDLITNAGKDGFSANFDAFLASL